jgi:hypothetical protein
MGNSSYYTASSIPPPLSHDVVNIMWVLTGRVCNLLSQFTLCWNLDLVLTTKTPYKFSEFLSDFFIAEIANQYFWLHIWNTLQEHFWTSNELARPKRRLVNFSDLFDKNGKLKIFWLFLKISQIWEFLMIEPSPYQGLNIIWEW